MENAPQADNKSEGIVEEPVVEAPKQEAPAQVETREAKLARGEAARAELLKSMSEDAPKPPSLSPEQNQKIEAPKPAETPKEEIPSQFKKEDGTLDDAKLAKSTENLQTLLDSKREKLEAYKQMQRELNGLQKEQSALEKQTPEKKAETPEVVAPIASPASLADLKRELLLDLEKDPSEALVKTMMHAVKYVEDRMAAREAEKAKAARQEGWLQKLDKHAETNPWVLSDEGFAAIKDVFNSRPHLRLGDDPYGDAMAFVDKSKFQGTEISKSNPAAASPKTPILSGGRAVPPPSPSTVSDEVQLKNLKAELAAAPDMKTKEAILDKMGELNKRIVAKKF